MAMNEHLHLTDHRALHQGRMVSGVWTGSQFVLKNVGFIGVDKTTISVYIGLNDKKGRKIYTGDIIKTYQDRIGVVRFLVKGGCFVYTIERAVNVHLRAPMAARLKVIGNIYQSKQANNILKDIKNEST